MCGVWVDAGVCGVRSEPFVLIFFKGSHLLGVTLKGSCVWVGPPLGYEGQSDLKYIHSARVWSVCKVKGVWKAVL